MLSPLVLLLLQAPAPPARPAPDTAVSASVAITNQTDDETNLGKGVLLAGGVSRVAGRHVRLETELSAGRHHRDSGYLAATGTPVTLTARAAWLIGGSARRTRPFLSAGLGVVHSRGRFDFRSIVPGPGGEPVDGPTTSTQWRLTDPFVELGLGAEVGTTGRLWWRPEVRASFTRTPSGFEPGRDVLALPLWTLRVGLTVGR